MLSLAFGRSVSPDLSGKRLSAIVGLVSTQSSTGSRLVVVRVGVILTVLLSSRLSYWMHLGISHSASVSTATEDLEKGS
jgi:hypothetical protein